MKKDYGTMIKTKILNPIWNEILNYQTIQWSIEIPIAAAETLKTTLSLTSGLAAVGRLTHNST